MCLLAFYSPGAQPDAAALSRAATRNPDGFGWAIVVGDEILTHRTLSASDGVSSFVEFRAMFPDGPALWHARFTTHGTTDVTNVHPFPVGGDPRVVVAHNGVLPVTPMGDRSDTHQFAADMLRLTDLENDGALYWLANWAHGSKLVVLSVHPDSSRQWWIVNEELGHWSDREPGVWYSNEGYREQVARVFTADPRGQFRVGAWQWDTDDDVTVIGATPNDDDGEQSDPWEFYTGGAIVECPDCGELWPGFCEWCDTCGTDIREQSRFVWDDDDETTGVGS